MSMEEDLKLLLGNKEMRDVTSYMVALLKDTEDKESLLKYKYLCSIELQKELRRDINDSRPKSNKPEINRGNRRPSIKDWARDRGVNVNNRRTSEFCNKV